MTKKTFNILLLLTLTLFCSNSFAQKKKKQTKVLISTSFGDMKLVLYNETPKHRDNFIKLVKEGYYDSLLFHRVINGFMIQGGDPDSRNAKPKVMLGNGGPDYTIPAEFNPKLYHKKGVLAAARQPDSFNPNKESNGSQFYIVQGRKFDQKAIDAYEKSKSIKRNEEFTYTEEQEKVYMELGGYPPLDMEYTVFGEVIEGLDVIDKIAAVETDRRDRPKEDVKMSMKIVKK